MATNELRTDLRITGENAVKRGLKDVGDAADRAGDQIEDLSAETGHLAKKAEEADAKVKDLVRTLDETGDLTLLKEIKKGKRELKLFEGLKAELEAELKAAVVEVASPAGDGGVGGVLGEGLAKGMGAAIKAGGPYMIAGIAAIAVASAPFIGATIASAVVGAAGAGGIAGGLALAAQDTRVKNAAEDLAGTAKTAFELAGQEMVLPAIDALNELERASQDIGVKLGHGFAAIAPTIKPLAEGLIGFADEFVDDLVVAMEDAKPVIRAIANELPEIGDALGDFFTIISEDPDGAVMAFKNLSQIIQGTLRATGHFIAALEDAYVWSVRTAGAAAHFMEDTFGWLPIVGDWFGATANRADHLIEGLDKANDESRDFAGGLSRVANEADDAGRELVELTEATRDLFGVTMSLDQAVLAYKQNLVDSRKELAEGTRTLDLNTQAGRDNMETALGRIGIIENLRDAEAESTLGIVEANKRYAERLEALKKDLLQLGYNKKAVEELIARYLAVPNAVNVQLNLKLGGDAQAWSALRAVERKNEVTGHLGPGGFEARAGGGPTRAGRTYVVGEHGPELWSEGANGYITPAAQTAALMSGASGGSGQPAVNVNIAPAQGGGEWGEFVRSMWPHIAKQLRVDAGLIGQYRIPRA